MSAGALARAARRLQGGQLDGAPVSVRCAAPVAARQQPRNRCRIDRKFVALSVTVSAAVGAAIGRRVQAHDITFGGERQAYCRSSLSHSRRGGERHTQGVLQGGRIGSHRLHVVSRHHRAAHVTVVGVMREERQCGTHAITGHQRFEIGFGASRKLPQLTEQQLHPVGIAAQSGEHALVGQTRRIEHRRDRGNSAHTIAEIMCQPAQQIVMYREPAHTRAVAAQS